MSDMEDSECSFTDLRAENDNKISVNIAAGYIYNKAKRVFQDSFKEIYEDLISRISYDYKIDLNELREKYPLEINVTKRKKIDPENACHGYTKKNEPCPWAKRDGYDYCGIHMKNQNDNKVDKSNSTPVAQEVKRNKNGGTYKPKKEVAEEEQEIEIEEIEENGEKFLLGSNHIIYYYPPNFDSDMTSLSDLKRAGIKKSNGKYIWD